MNKKLAFVCCLLFSLQASQLQAEPIEPVHYAYANYLGSGIYRAAEQDITLINLPFLFELGKDKELTYSLRTPVSFGFFGFSYADIPELDLPDSVGSVTFTPGVQIDYQLSEQLVLQSYVDVGFARNFTTRNDVLVYSFGITSLYSFTAKKYDSIIATRLYHASYKSFDNSGKDGYAALQLGIDTGYAKKFKVFGRTFQPRVFATSFWYFNDVDFLFPDGEAAFSSEQLNAQTDDSPISNNVTLTNSFELGVTLKFDKYIGYDWLDINTLGLSYRFSGDYSALRLLFSFPI